MRAGHRQGPLSQFRLSGCGNELEGPFGLVVSGVKPPYLALPLGYRSRCRTNGRDDIWSLRSHFGRCTEPFPPVFYGEASCQLVVPSPPTPMPGSSSSHCLCFCGVFPVSTLWVLEFWHWGPPFLLRMDRDVMDCRLLDPSVSPRLFYAIRDCQLVFGRQDPLRKPLACGSVPNNYIGGSGVVTCHEVEVQAQTSGVSSYAMLWGDLAYLFLSAFRGLLLHLRLALFLALCRRLIPGRLLASQRLRKVILLSRIPVPESTMLAFAGFSPGGGRPLPLSLRSLRSCKIERRHGRRVGQVQGSGRTGCSCLLSFWLFRACLFLWGLLSLPCQAWAAPAGMPEALSSLAQVVNLCPEPLDHRDLTGSRANVEAPNNVTATWLWDSSPDSPVPVTPRHCLLFSAGYPTRFFLAHVDLPCGPADVFAETVTMCQPLCPFSSIQATNPQIARDVATLVVVPNWLRASEQVVVLLDFSFWDGPVFAAVEWSYTNRNSVAHYARLHAQGPWDVFHGNSTEPLRSDRAVFAVSGDVFIFRPAGAELVSRPLFHDLLSQPDSWRETPCRVPREIASCRLYAMRSHVTRTPHYAGTSWTEALQVVSEAFDSEPEELHFVFPKSDSPLHDLVYKGFQIRRVLAATPQSTSGQRVNRVLFVDARGLGLEPFFVEYGQVHVSPEQLVAHLGCQVPPGFCIQADGVTVENGLFSFADTDTVALRFCPCDLSPPPTRRISAPPAFHSVIAGGGSAGTARQAADGQGRPHGPHARTREDPPPPDPVALLDLAESEEEADEPDGLFTAVFLIFTPRFQPEHITLYLPFPCDIELALQEVDGARGSQEAIHFDRLLPAVPQPDTAFGSVLAVPSWAAGIACILVDSRALDGKLFALDIRGRLNRSSLLVHLDLHLEHEIDVFLHGRVMDGETWYTFLPGDTIKLVPSGGLPPVPVALEDMLRDHYDWMYPGPALLGPSLAAVLALSDGFPKVISVNVDEDTSSEDFLARVADIFGYNLDRVFVCQALPRIDNLAVLGQKCDSALVVTESVPQIPIPPGRLRPALHILLLDARYLLRDVTWITAPHGRVDVATVVAPFSTLRQRGRLSICQVRRPFAKGAAL